MGAMCPHGSAIFLLSTTTWGYRVYLASLASLYLSFSNKTMDVVETFLFEEVIWAKVEHQNGTSFGLMLFLDRLSS